MNRYDDELIDAIVHHPHPLSDQQKRAVLSQRRHVRIVAGAGAGKTETLTRRILYLLLGRQADPASIVAFTFTEKAAVSMKSRVYDRLKQIRGEEYLAEAGKMYIGTIHGFCLQLLQDKFGYDDHQIMDENQEMAFVMREGWGLGLSGNGRYSEACAQFIKSSNVVYDELIRKAELAQESPGFSRQLEHYEGILSQYRLFTFGKLIYTAVQKLQEDPEKIRHIDHLIVDEYQDINHAQETLIRIIGETAGVFVVGDPRQSIYQWRGSDERCFHHFNRHFDDCDSVAISGNRRSGKEIIDAANGISSCFTQMKYAPLDPLRGTEGAANLVILDRPEDEAYWVADQIHRLVAREECEYGDIALLLRSVTTSAAPFLEQLKMRDIPFLIGGKVGLFRRQEAKALGYLFSWLWDDGFWRENPYAWREKTIGRSLLHAALENWEAATGLSRRDISIKALENWRLMALSGVMPNITRILFELLVILGFRQLDPRDKLAASVMANVGRFSSLLADFESAQRLGGRRSKWPVFFKNLCWFLNTYAMGAYEEQSADDIRGVDAVQVMTVHQAKGLEWPVVFIPSMVEQRFPSGKVGKEQTWLLSRRLFDVERYEGNEDDERRLFYVASTRARDLLTISAFSRMKNRRRLSRFIDEIKHVLCHSGSYSDIRASEIVPMHSDNELQTFSAGELISYMQCPYFYRLREIWNFKPEIDNALGYGRTLHSCLKYAADLIHSGVPIDSAAHQAIDEKFHLPYAPKQAFDQMQANAHDILSRFVQRHLEDFRHIEDTEVRLEFPIFNSSIIGRADVLLQKSDRLEVRDYKTSDDPRSFEQAAFQLQLYTLGLRRQGYSIESASVAYLGDAHIQDVDISDSGLEHAHEQAISGIQGILKQDYCCSPGSNCRKCDYNSICHGVNAAVS